MQPVRLRQELILVVGIDRATHEAACDALRQAGFGVLSCSAKSLQTRLRDLKPDVVVLYAGDRLSEAAEACRALRRQGATPIVVIGSVLAESAPILILEAGSDDYVREPLRSIEFVARVRAVLRRARSPHAARAEITVGPLSLDEARCAAAVDQRQLSLSLTEYRLLAYLARHPNRVVPYTDLIARGWGVRAEASRDVLRVTMSRLRRKIGADRHRDLHLHVVPRRGYRLAIEATSIGPSS